MTNFFDQLPDASNGEIFQSLLKAPNVHIERITSLGQCSPVNQWYDQAQSEWVLLLEGAAIIEFENGHTINLKPGDYLNIPAHQKHRVAWTQPEQKTLWLAVHFTS